jgi:hypothetical protein
MERRRFSRISPRVNREASIQYNGQLIKGKIRDISLGGMFFKTPKRVPVDEEVEIDIFPSEIALEHPDAVVGTVTWHGDDGMGIQFDRVETRALIAFLDLVDALSRD